MPRYSRHDFSSFLSILNGPLCLDKTPAVTGSTLNGGGFGSMGKRIKPVLHEGFNGYQVAERAITKHESMV